MYLHKTTYSPDGTESSELSIPTLTTIKQPIKEICIDAVNKLIKLINNENISLESNHTVTLIKGETTWYIINISSTLYVYFSMSISVGVLYPRHLQMSIFINF